MARPFYDRRASRRARRVLLALLSGAGNLSGFVICRAAQVGSGTVYPVLAKLESNGWVSSEWDTVEQPGGGRRRFYRLTDEGRSRALRLLGLEARDFFPVADEDEDFADEWDDPDSNAYQARVEAGLEQEDR